LDATDEQSDEHVPRPLNGHLQRLNAQQRGVLKTFAEFAKPNKKTEAMVRKKKNSDIKKS